MRAFGIHTATVVDAALFANVGLVFIKFERFEVNLDLDQLLDVRHQAGVTLGHKAHGQAGCAGTAGASDAVHIVFGVERHVEVEHRRHVLDVQAARGHIGTHQQIDLALFEGIKGFESFILALVTMQGRGVEALALQRARQAGTTKLAVDKDKGLLDASRLEDLVQRMPLILVTHAVKMLLDRGGGGIGARHLDRHRALQVAAGQALDLGRKSGREQQRGALLGQVAQDALQVGQKADVQHAVRLVQHHVLHLTEHRVLGFDVVQQPPGGGHQHLNAFFQLQRLRLHVDTAEHHRAAQLGVLGIGFDGLRHLVRQLARGQQHQGAHRVPGR